MLELDQGIEVVNSKAAERVLGELDVEMHNIYLFMICHDVIFRYSLHTIISVDDKPHLVS